MASVVALVGPSRTLYLHGTAKAPYAGSGTPWTSASTTPFAIANNDVTGERWRLIAPPRTPLQSGAVPFSPWAATQGYVSGNRLLAISLQLYATTDAHLSALKEELVASLFDPTVAAAGLYLQVAWGGRTVIACIESATFQEDHRYWNDEAASHMLRGVLTLECRIGSASAYEQLAGEEDFDNATTHTASFDNTDITGDWRSIGQPLILSLSGGSSFSASGTKVVYAATTRGTARSGTLSASLVTNSTSGGSETGSLTLATANIRGTRYRVLAELSGASSNLELRACVRWTSSSGQLIYLSPYIDPPAATAIVDLGSFSPQHPFTPGGSAVHLAVQARSTDGSNTTGTLTRLHILQYSTFCEIRPPDTVASQVIRIRSASPGTVSTGPMDGAAIVETLSGTPLQRCEVRGSLPVAIRNAGLFLAWTHDGTFFPTDAIIVEAEYLPLFETIAGS